MKYMLLFFVAFFIVSCDNKSHDNKKSQIPMGQGLTSLDKDPKVTACHAKGMVSVYTNQPSIPGQEIYCLLPPDNLDNYKVNPGKQCFERDQSNIFRMTEIRCLKQRKKTK